MTANYGDPLAPLRSVLRQPDRRTWRRFLPTTPRAHGATPAPSGSVDGDAEPDARRRLPVWQVAAGASILAIGLVLVTGLLPPTSPQPAPDAAVAPAGGADPAVDPGPGPEDATVVGPPFADPPGRGERVWPAAPVEVAGREVRTDAGRWEVGREGDLVAVGDWDCDRRPTPAVLRPSDGRVAVFDGWATDDAELAGRPVGTVDAGVAIRPGQTCGEVVVRTARGSDQVLDTRTRGAGGP